MSEAQRSFLEEPCYAGGCCCFAHIPRARSLQCVLTVTVQRQIRLINWHKPANAKFALWSPSKGARICPPSVKRLVGKLQTTADLVNFFYSSSSSKRTITWAKLHGSWVVIHVLKGITHTHTSNHDVSWCHISTRNLMCNPWWLIFINLQVTKGCSWTSHGWAVSGRLTMSRLGQKCPMRSTNGFDCTVSSLSAASKGPFKGKIPTTRIAPPVNKTWLTGMNFESISCSRIYPRKFHWVMTCMKGISKYPCNYSGTWAHRKQLFRLNSRDCYWWKNWTFLEKHH